jgi:hypothetical protein
MADIEPMRLGVIDIVTLSDRETRGALVLLAGNPDPVVTEALVDAVRRILERTRVSPADSGLRSPFPGRPLPPL